MMAVDQIARMMAMDAAQQGGGTTDAYTKAETDAMLAKKPGEITTGKQYTIDGRTVTAGTGAEVFNNLANNKAAGKYSHAEGFSTTASGYASHAEGNATTSNAAMSHSEGYGTIAASNFQHVQGKYNLEDSNNKYAFIIGNGNDERSRSNAFSVSWDGSVSSGFNATASGLNSHAEGQSAIASGSGSHAEGGGTTASSSNSHAEGNNTKASSANQHVQGKFNVEDANDTYAFIIGNGTGDNARHNAFAVDWNGLIYVNGAATGVDVSQLTPVTVDQTYNAQSTNAQSGTAVAQAVSGKISSTDYATQTTGGTVKAWTTTDGSDTILHLATQ